MTWQWWQTRSAIALAATSSPNTFPQPPMPTLVVMIVEGTVKILAHFPTAP